MKEKATLKRVRVSRLVGDALCPASADLMRKDAPGMNATRTIYHDLPRAPQTSEAIPTRRGDPTVCPSSYAALIVFFSFCQPPPGCRSTRSAPAVAQRGGRPFATSDCPRSDFPTPSRAADGERRISPAPNQPKSRGKGCNQSLGASPVGFAGKIGLRLGCACGRF